MLIADWLKFYLWRSLIIIINVSKSLKNVHNLYIDYINVNELLYRVNLSPRYFNLMININQHA